MVHAREGGLGGGDFGPVAGVVAEHGYHGVPGFEHEVGGDFIAEFLGQAEESVLREGVGFVGFFMGSLGVGHFGFVQSNDRDGLAWLGGRLEDNYRSK